MSGEVNEFSPPLLQHSQAEFVVDCSVLIYLTMIGQQSNFIAFNGDVTPTRAVINQEIIVLFYEDNCNGYIYNFVSFVFV